MLKKVFILTFVIILCASSISLIYATEEATDTSIENLLGTEKANVTTEEVVGYVENKSSLVISFLQYAAEPVLIIAFIVSAFIAGFGGIGNGNLIGKGLMGMVISGISYSAILFAPEILNIISSFFRP